MVPALLTPFSPVIAPQKHPPIIFLCVLHNFILALLQSMKKCRLPPISSLYMPTET